MDMSTPENEALHLEIDRDTLTYAEVKALASGNPLILEKFDLFVI